MWTEARKLLGTPKEARYIGDAAGRIKGWDPKDKKRKDFSNELYISKKYLNPMGKS